MAGWLLPYARLWGIHHFGFLSPFVSAGLLLTAFVCFTPFGERAIGAMLPKLRRLHGAVLIWALIAGAVFVVARVREPLLGDGQALLRHLEIMGRLEARRLPVIDKGDARWAEPLETALHENFFRMLALWHPPVSSEFSPDQDEEEVRAERAWFFEVGRWSYILLSAAAGVIFVVVVVGFSARMLSAPVRPIFLLAVFGSGGMLLFFGYAEDYAWVSLAVTGCVLAAIEVRPDSEKWPWKTVAWFVAAVAFHLMALFLLPVVIYLILRRHLPLFRDANRLAWRVLLGGLLLTTVGYAVTRPWTWSKYALAIFPGNSKDGYSVLSIRHIVDILNLLLLVAPLASLVILMFHRSDAHQRHATRVLRLAAGAGIGFVLLFNPGLGMSRDWDLYSVTLWPLVLLGAWGLANVAWERQRNAVLACMCGCTLLIAVPFVLVHQSARAEIVRFKAILGLDLRRTAYGWENLAAYYRRVRDPHNVIIALENSVGVDPNPRYKLNLANELRRAGRLEEAEYWYLESVRMRPDFVKNLVMLCQSYAQRGDNRKAIEVARKMTEIEPDNPIFTQLLSDLIRVTASP